MADEDPASTDEQAVRAWLRDNPTVAARLIIDAGASQPAGGPGALVVHVPEHGDMLRAREELTRLMQDPSRLRVRRWRPGPDEIERVTAQVWKGNPPLGCHPRVTTTGLDDQSGLLAITLSQVDQEYAAELESSTDGLAFVLPEPVNPIALSG